MSLPLCWQELLQLAALSFALLLEEGWLCFGRHIPLHPRSLE
jgi:hypothetical protein